MYMQVVDTELFRCLQEIHGNDYSSFIARKLVPVVGDVREANIGIAPELADEIAGQVDIIINSAANTTFDERFVTCHTTFKICMIQHAVIDDSMDHGHESVLRFWWQVRCRHGHQHRGPVPDHELRAAVPAAQALLASVDRSDECETRVDLVVKLEAPAFFCFYFPELTGLDQHCV